MAIKRGNSNMGIRRNNGGGGSWMSIVVLVLFLVLAPVGFFVGRRVYSAASVG